MYRNEKTRSNIKHCQIAFKEVKKGIRIVYGKDLAAFLSRQTSQDLTLLWQAMFLQKI